MKTTTDNPFEDPVAYLALFGLDAELVEESDVALPNAA